MSSTRFNIGLDNSGRNSSKVLKPPGGGTSDLFTVPNGVEEEKIRIAQSLSQNNHQEQIGANGTEKTGVPDNKPEEIVSILEPVGDVPLSKIEEPKQTVSSISRNCVTGDGCQTEEHFAIRVHRQRDGNPVTGEGYDLAKSASQNSAAAPAPSKARVPPGGYSSGLW